MATTGPGTVENPQSRAWGGRARDTHRAWRAWRPMSGRRSRAAGRSPAGSRPVRASASRTVLLARSDASAWKAEEQAHSLCAKVDRSRREAGQGDHRAGDLADCDVVVEAVRRGARAEGRAAQDRWATPRPMPTWRRPPPRSRWTSSRPAAATPSASSASIPSTPWSRMELVELCLPEAGRRADRPACARLVRVDRQDGGRGPERAGVRRQPAALPLPLRRGAPDGADRDERPRRSTAA